MTLFPLNDKIYNNLHLQSEYQNTNGYGRKAESI
jgi:hypothetical protein